MARNNRTWETCSLPFQHVLFVEQDPRVPSDWVPTMTAADLALIRRATGPRRFIVAVELHRQARAAQRPPRPVVPAKVPKPPAPKRPTLPADLRGLSYTDLLVVAHDYGLTESDLRALILTEPRLASFRRVFDD